MPVDLINDEIRKTDASKAKLQFWLMFTISFAVAIIALVFAYGIAKGTNDTELTSIKKSIENIENNQTIINNQILKNRLIYESQNATLYKELIEVQYLDKQVIDNKFDLVIKYGIKDNVVKDNLYSIFELLDNKKEADIKKLHNNNTLNIDIDTTKIE